MRRNYVLLLTLVSLAFISACTHVQPWERGVLAQSAMAPDPTPTQTLRRNHTFNSREAAAQVDPVGGGGGCGCY